MAPAWFRKIFTICCFPQRYFITFMTSLALLNAFAMRTTVQITLFDLGQDTTTIFPNSTCHPGADAYKSKSNISSSLRSQELISSAFYWGYICTNLPGGIASDLYGGKHVLSAGILGSAVLTLITPTIVGFIKGDEGALLAVGTIQGAFSGLVYPAIAAVLAHWVPEYQRNFLAGIAFSGAQLGSAVVWGNAHLSWPCIFHLYGTLGIVWCCFWQVFAYSSPKTHPGIGQNEKEFLSEQLGEHIADKKINFKQMPWISAIASSHVWALVGAELGYTWIYSDIGLEMPRYMRDVLKFSENHTKLLLSIVYLCMWFMSIIFGFLCDWLIKYSSVVHTRMLFTTIAFTGSGLFLFCAASAACNRIGFMICFVVAFSLLSAYNAGTKANVLDLSPNFAGFVMGIANGLGSGMGIVAPVITLFATPHHALWQWYNAFFVTFIVVFLTNLVYLTYCSGERQPWNVKNSEDNENK